MYVFRTPTINDVDWITRACQDAEILRFTVVPRPYTTEHARRFVEDFAGEHLVWAIHDDDPDIGIGVVGVHHVIDAVASIGYWIAPWARRRGAAVAAVRFVCDELATWPSVDVVTATIAETNTASQSVVRRAGFIESNRGCDTKCPDGSDSVGALVFERRLKK